jgi:hypothetical protein
MKTLFPVPVGLIVLILIISCEKQTSWELDKSENFPVAECILTNELKYQEIRLYFSLNSLNEDPVGIRDAMIEITDGNMSVAFLSDPLESGHYVSAIPFRASAGRIYRLTVAFEGFADTAWAEMTGVSPLDDIDIAPFDTLFHIVYHDSPQASMTEIQYNWSASPSYCEKYGSCLAAEVFYTLDNIDVAKEFAPDRLIIPFPKGTEIIRRKYSLNDAHQQFIRAMLLETDWRGGLFDAEQGNVPTNFHHGIHGWFALSAVVTDTISYQ